MLENNFVGDGVLKPLLIFTGPRRWPVIERRMLKLELRIVETRNGF